MQMPLDPQLKAVSALLGTDWISLEDIQTKLSSLKRSQRLSVVHPDAFCVTVPEKTDAVPEVDDNNDDRHSCCWRCCCCCCRRQEPKRDRRRSRNTNRNVNHSSGGGDPSCLLQDEPDPADLSHYRKPIVVTYQPGRTKSVSVECVALGNPDAANGQLNSLRRAADSVQTRCTAIYNKINEDGTALRAAVERYFEQDRGILVFGTESLGAGGGVAVSCICTLPEHVQKLREDASEKLVADLESIVGNASGSLVRLSVRVDENQLDLSAVELGCR